MKFNIFIVAALALVNLAIYLFVTAPSALSDNTAQGKRIPIAQVLAMVDQENQIARKLYAQEIVGAGKAAGLVFEEHWRDADVPAGPLPAQFLRLAAAALEVSTVRLGLYLGSDYPINPANRFTGQTLERFVTLRATRQPVAFTVVDTGRYAYMSPDLASAESCVQCHNAHPDTTKNDWALNNVMGATTWTYPAATVSADEMLRIVAQWRAAVAHAYIEYLQKAATFPAPPTAGTRWPRDGYEIPSVDVFMNEIAARASAGTVARVTAALATTQNTQ